MTDALVNADLALILDAAREAGELILKRREAGLTVEYKAGGSPVSNADTEADQLLQSRLMAARPDYGWLSEEIADSTDRLERKRIFLVDPIDGTRAYVKGRPWFAVSIAVVEDGAPIAGVVLAPALDETYTAALGQGAWLNGSAIAPSAAASLEDCAMLGDEPMFLHPAWPTPWPKMRIETRNSIAYRLCLVASGAFDAAVAPSGKSDWDLGAADLICREAGAVCCDSKGRAFVYNRPIPQQTGLMAAAPALAPLILERLRPIEWRS